MRRIADALREWMQLRRRLREERRFHLESAAAELRGLGLSQREASRMVRRRFGGRRHLRSGLRELGGDIPGLARLLCAYRVPASAWLQPASLVALIALILAVSPAPRGIIEGVIGAPLAAQDRQEVILSAAGWTPSERIVTPAEFETLRTLRTLSAVERHGAYVRARAVRGASLASIQSELHTRTGTRRIWAGWLFSENQIITGPAQIVWLLLWFYILSSLCQGVSSGRRGRWFLYGFLTAFLHSVASLMAWSLMIQVWTLPIGGAAAVFLALVFYMLLSAMQCRWWRRDLNQRCSVCLDGLVLPLTEGTAERVLLESAITESVCAHGHGVLVESRWSRRFRPEQSPLGGLVRI